MTWVCRAITRKQKRNRAAVYLQIRSSYLLRIIEDEHIFQEESLNDFLSLTHIFIVAKPIVKGYNEKS